MKKIVPLSFLLLLVTLFQFCTKNDSLDVSTESVITTTPVMTFTSYNYLDTYPAHIQVALASSDNTPATNPITNEGANLGRVLFYDKQLSRNGTISCGSCHQQKNSFSDSVVFSRGLDGGATTRHSMALLNMRFYKSGKMFWDDRAAALEKQALQPIQNHVEMDMTLELLEAKVKSLTYYPSLFQKAFGTSLIDSVLIAKALSQFQRTIVTYQSKYDRVKRGLEIFTAAEAAGEELFLTVPANRTCASCHTPPMFITSSPSAPFGLDDTNDLGINNRGNFKSGSLRNISIRSNLFHNGSVANVQEMLTAGNPGSGKQPIPSHFLRTADIPNMLAFLNTLTDKTILTEAKFSDPFAL
jgi:cytochrome c peroxidase